MAVLETFEFKVFQVDTRVCSNLKQCIHAVEFEIKKNLFGEISLLRSSQHQLPVAYSCFNASTGLVMAAFHNSEAIVMNMITTKITTGRA